MSATSTATYGTNAVDWETRISFDRLRDERLARLRSELEASELGALLAFDFANIRYISATHIGTWAMDKLIRFALDHPQLRPDRVGLRIGGPAPPAVQPVAVHHPVEGGCRARLLGGRGGATAGRDRGTRRHLDAAWRFQPGRGHRGRVGQEDQA